MARIRLQRSVGAVLAAALVVAGTGCSESRSVQAFCQTLESGSERMRQVAGRSSEQAGLLEGLAVAIGNLGEFEQMLRELADVAPDEIASDMRRAHSVYAQQLDSVGEGGTSITAAVGTAFGALMAGLANQTAFDNVDRYAEVQCGRTVFALSALQAPSHPDDANGGRSDDETDEPPEPSVVTLADIDEPGLVVCDQDTLQFMHVGLDSGEVQPLTPQHDMSQLVGAFDSNHGGGTIGQGSTICSPSTDQIENGLDRYLVDADYTALVGVSYTDTDDLLPIVLDLTDPQLGYRFVLEAMPVSDFGSSRPETFVASFTPDGQGLYWRESTDGRCASFLVAQLEDRVSRADQAGYQVGTGGRCFNTNMTVRWKDGTPLVCAQGLGCDDPDGDDVPLESIGAGTRTGPVRVDPPPSERFTTSSTFYVAGTGSYYFLGTDRDTEQVSVFAWDGGRGEPELIADIGPVRAHIFRYEPGSDVDAAAAEQAAAEQVAPQLPPEVDDGNVRVCVDQDVPFDDPVSRGEAELMARMVEPARVGVEFIPVAFADIVSGALFADGTCEVAAAAIQRTDERQKTVRLTQVYHHLPYGMSLAVELGNVEFADYLDAQIDRLAGTGDLAEISDAILFDEGYFG